jgi:2-keto-4-pentenoate hydratase/2-oxohepta-3-ene-1,7-dioic acid hydratase in catechol pathway
MTTDGSWSLATYRLDGETHAGALLEDGTVVACEELREFRGLMDAMADWDAVASRLEGWSPDRGAAVEGAELTAPLLYPGKLLCAGANYRTHVEEMGVSLEGRGTIEPFLFLLPATNTVVGHGESIRIPASPDARVDWEGELAVVIGRAGRNISREDAPAHVAGYTIINDISARGPHRRADPLAPPFEWDWLASKGRDTFNPMGPGLVPAWLIDDPHELQIRLWVNDELKQDSPTNDMIADVWDLIAYASTMLELAPGDVIATGSPPGVGMPRGEFLSVGDTVTIEISKIGRLANPVEEEQA